MYNCKLLMTEVNGSMIRYIHHLTMVHTENTIVCSRITQAVSSCAFLNFELTWLLLLCVAAVF